MSSPPNLAASVGSWSARNRRKAILAWLVFVVAAFVVGSLVGQRNLTDAEMGNGQSGAAVSVFEKGSPITTARRSSSRSSRGSAEPGGRLRRGGRLGRSSPEDSRRCRHRISVAGERCRREPGVAVRRWEVVPGQLRAGGRQQPGPNLRQRATRSRRCHRHRPSQLIVQEFGSASATKAIGAALTGDFAKAEHTSLPITLIILLLAFGALIAAGVPLLLGFTTVIAALGLMKPISHLVPVAQGQIEPVVLLVGLAVGVDYSMFYLRRKLEERRAGHDNATALARAAATSGRAVLISA